MTSGFGDRHEPFRLTKLVTCHFILPPPWITGRRRLESSANGGWLYLFSGLLKSECAEGIGKQLFEAC
jgi:hypothetical protein